MGQPILELRHVHKRFGAAVAAEDLSLAIEAGEFFTLLGPSGSGKSTILRIIAGLDEADAGEVRLKGREVGDVPPWGRHLGMVFQQYTNFPHMNVGQNVAYGLRRSGLARDEIRVRVQGLLALVGLAGFQERRVATLSGGEQQRVAIARALAPRPELLLLDEPLAALDEKIRREMQEELRAIQRATGTTFVHVTHDQEEALTMSDRIAVLNRGRCVQCDQPEQIFRFPRTRFVASFFRGCNVLEAELERDAAGHATLVLAGRLLPLEPRADGRAVRSRSRCAARPSCSARRPRRPIWSCRRGSRASPIAASTEITGCASRTGRSCRRRSPGGLTSRKALRSRSGSGRRTSSCSRMPRSADAGAGRGSRAARSGPASPRS